MKSGHAPRETPIMIDHNGKVFQGSYHIERDTITVSYETRRLVARLDRIPAPTLARMMLREMIAGKPREAATVPRLPQWNHK
jgi:hypothetical protein